MRTQLFKLLPALLTMAVIFWFSSQPSNELPNFGLMDRIIKKSGHVFEYAVLTFWIWYASDFRKDRCWFVWLIAILYAVTDEYHQSFVVGRYPSVWDVVIFDNVGALLSLWFAQHFLNKNDQTVSSDRHH